MTAKMSAKNSITLKAVICLALFLIISFLTPPEGLERSSMICLAVLVSVIFSVSTNLMDEFLSGSLGLILLSFLRVADFKTVFSGFSSTTFILLLGAFGMGGVLSQCGALQRIGSAIVSKFPKTFRGRVTAMYIAGMVISPTMPSGSAKGIIMSLLSTPVAKEMGYKPKSQAGTGLFIAGWIPVGVIGICFLSGAVSGPLLAGMTDAEYLGEYTWVKWFLNSLVFGIVMLIGCYIANLILYKPRPEDMEQNFSDIDTTSEKTPMTFKQKLSLVVVCAVLLLWIFGRSLKLTDAVVSFAGFVLLVLMGVVDRKKALSTAVPWGTLIFSAFVLSISTVITEVGLGDWLTSILGSFLIPVMNNMPVFIALTCIGIYIIRTVVISQTLITSMMYMLLMPIAVKAGINPWIIGFLCAVSIVTWNVLPQSIPFLSAFGASDGGEYPSFPQAFKMSVFVMLWTIVSCWASIPVWKLMGMM